MANELKKGFLLYFDYRQHLALLSDEERGRLLSALLDYGELGKEPDMEGAALMAFSFIRAQMDRDAAKYAETVKKRSEAGKQGGRPAKAKDDTEKQEKAKKANAFSDNQSAAKKGDTDTNTDTVTGTNNVTDTVTGTETGSPPYPPTKGEPPVPYSAICEMYHEICKSYPKLRAVEGTRKRQIAARWKKYKTLDTFRELFKKAETSDFLKGENENGWAADFDWLIRPTNMSKVLEGKYDNEKNKGGQTRGKHSGNTEQREPESAPSLSGFQMADD